MIHKTGQIKQLSKNSLLSYSFINEIIRINTLAKAMVFSPIIEPLVSVLIVSYSRTLLMMGSYS